MNKIRDKREREKENDTVLSGTGFLASGGKLQRKEMRFKKHCGLFWAASVQDLEQSAQ